MTSCKHQYHTECLKSNIDDTDTLPNWVRLCCPLCKMATNLIFSVSGQYQHERFISYEEAIIQIINTNDEMANCFYD